MAKKEKKVEPVDDADVKSVDVPSADDLNADTPPESVEPPKVQGPNVVFGVEAPAEAVTALLAAFPDAKEIVIKSFSKNHVVAEIDFVPRKICWKALE